MKNAEYIIIRASTDEADVCQIRYRNNNIRMNVWMTDTSHKPKMNNDREQIALVQVDYEHKQSGEVKKLPNSKNDVSLNSDCVGHKENRLCILQKTSS